jgi:hypothetical protein
MTWRIKGIYALGHLHALRPDGPLPPHCTANPFLDAPPRPRRSWTKRAQRGFVDLCHAYRGYCQPYPPAGGSIPREICTVCASAVWAARQTEATIGIGFDDPIRVYLNGACILDAPGRTCPDPLEHRRVGVTLAEGINRLWVVCGNTANRNWAWNGFSLVIDSPLPPEELLYVDG